jgi:hypothetical protein
VVFVAAASLTNLYAPPLPDWWSNPSTRILDPANPATIEDNYAPTNLGQLKHVAQQAKEHLDEHLPGGAGSAINALVESFEPRSGQSYTPSQIEGFLEANYAPLNLGQLKAVAKPFYDRLQSFQYDTRANLISRGIPGTWIHSYPWDSSTPPSENYAIANLGQLKLVFSFDLSAPVGQLPLWWQRLNFDGQVSIDPDEDADGDGFTNFQEYQGGSDPRDYYSRANGVITPRIFVYSGGDATVEAGQYSSAPVVFKVVDNANGLPLVNAPVTVEVASGTGLLSQTSGGMSQATLTMRTDVNGLVTPFFKAP